MLTNDCFLPNLVALSKPASFLTSIGFYWNPESSKMKPFPPNSRNFFIHTVTTKVHLLLLLLVLLQTGLSKEPSLPRKMISSFGLIVILFCGLTVQVYQRNLEKCTALINELVKMSTDIQNEVKTGEVCCNGGAIKMDVKEKIIKLLAPTLQWSAMAVPFAFVGGVVWSMPCMASNLGYFLLQECSTEESKLIILPKHLTKCIFLLTNLWIWSYGVQCAVFVVIVVMLGAVSLRSYLKYYQRSMISSFPKLNNCLHRNAVMFRRIQMLTRRFNDIHQSKILVPLIFTVTSHQVFSVYGAIKFAGQLNLVSYALFFILGNQGVMVIMGMFTGLADVYTMSRGIKTSLQRSQRGHKWLRRFHASCQLIKIRFGAVNFIDSFTPLGFENFAVVQTTNMLMVD